MGLAPKGDGLAPAVVAEAARGLVVRGHGAVDLAQLGERRGAIVVGPRVFWLGEERFVGARQGRHGIAPAERLRRLGHGRLRRHHHLRHRRGLRHHARQRAHDDEQSRDLSHNHLPDAPT
jgi:hypothetical protein